MSSSELWTNSSLAAVITALIVAVGGLPERIRARAQASILGLAFVAGACLVGGRPSYPPADLASSFLWVGVLLAAYTWLRPKAFGTRYFLRAAFVLAVGALLFGQMQNVLHTYVYQRNLAAFFCLALGIWSIMERTVASVGAPSLVGLPLLSTAALVAFLFRQGNVEMARLAAVAVGMLSVLTVIALFKPKWLSAEAAVPFASTLVIALMAATHFKFGYNPWWIIALCIPFAGLWLRELLPIPQKPILEFVILASITMLPMAYFFGMLGG